MYYTATPSGREASNYYGRDMRTRARANNIEGAAQHIAHRLHGRRAAAYRQTGTSGMSGVWHCYVPTRNSQATEAIGGNLHIAEEV